MKLKLTPEEIKDCEARMEAMGFEKAPSSDTLKPLVMKFCPFCGRMELSIQMEPAGTTREPRQRWFVECAYCESKSGSYETVELATKHWNERAIQHNYQRCVAVGS